MRFFARSSGDSRGRWSSSRRNSSNHSPASAGGTGPADTFPNSPSISPQAEREAEDPWAAADFLPGLPAGDASGHVAAAAGLSGGVGGCGVGSPGGVMWDRCVVRDGAGQLPGSTSRMPSFAREERGLSGAAALPPGGVPGGSSCGGSGIGQRRPKQLPEARDGFGAALAATGGRASIKPPSPCIPVPHKDKDSRVWEMGGAGVSGSTSRRSSPAQSATGSTFSAGSGTLSFSPSAAEALAECEARSASRKESRRRRRPSEWAALFVGLDRSGGGSTKSTPVAGSTKGTPVAAGGSTKGTPVASSSKGTPVAGGPGSARNTPVDGRTPVDGSTPVRSLRRTSTPQTPPMAGVIAVTTVAAAGNSTVTVASTFPSTSGRGYTGGEGTTPVASTGVRGGSGEPSKRTPKRTPPRPKPAPAERIGGRSRAIASRGRWRGQRFSVHRGSRRRRRWWRPRLLRSASSHRHQYEPKHRPRRPCLPDQPAQSNPQPGRRPDSGNLPHHHHNRNQHRLRQPGPRCDGNDAAAGRPAAAEDNGA
ncbi:unnamed protein product, partial [Scytosiphon promiscuus]